jgi:hypothetical protein
MNLNIMIPDDTVRQMLSSGRRIQGTISLANAKEGNFHPHHRQDYVAPRPQQDGNHAPLRQGHRHERKTLATSQGESRTRGVSRLDDYQRLPRGERLFRGVGRLKNEEWMMSY